MKIGFVSLGCPKNLVDSEVMLGLAEQAGHEITAEADGADVLVVNTCAFIDRAKQESIDTILEMAELKKQAAGRRLVVTGCLAERYRDELQQEIPEIDAVLGTGEVPRILEALGGAATPATMRAQPLTFYTRDPHAKAAVAETRGLWHRPAGLSLRRRHPAPPGDAWPLRLPEDRRRLRLQVRVLHHPEDARPLPEPHRPSRSCARREQLAAQGVKELLLISQDTTFYGIDRTGTRRACPAAARS